MARHGAATSRSSCRLPEDLPRIQGDDHQLTQVFANLLINAYEALEGQGAVTLTARLVDSSEDGALLPDGDHPVPTMIVEVADTGPGVTPDVPDKIFNPFFTTKAAGLWPRPGHRPKDRRRARGRIDVRSARQSRHMFPCDVAGCTYRRVGALTSRERNAESRHHGPNTGSRRSRRAAAGARAGARAAGHEIEEAGNGNAAIEKLHENYFDVVVSDLKMGGSMASTCCAPPSRCIRRPRSS